MDSDQGKLFIGGISWDTNEEKLKEHFGNYGDVLNASVMREKNTGKPRGFAFVVFADPSVLDRVLEDKHLIDGRTVMPLFFGSFSLQISFSLAILLRGPQPLLFLGSLFFFPLLNFVFGVLFSLLLLLLFLKIWCY